MKLVGLISGGKDSLFNMMQCIAAGHEIVAVANIEPETKGELDSYMYQSVGHEVILLLAEALDLPLFRHKTKGKAICKEKIYVGTLEDEVEDLFALLTKVKDTISIEGVSVGAILSDYQRTRVEHVCSRLGLKCFAYLWRRDQAKLLQEMIDAKLDAILIKVACFGLKSDIHLGKSIKEVQPYLSDLNVKYGVNVCGEGGEYETLTLDSPLFHRSIKITDSEKIILSNCAFAPVGIINVKRAVLKSKNQDGVVYLQDRIKLIQCVVKNPYHYVMDCESKISQEESQADVQAISSTGCQTLPNVRTLFLPSLNSTTKCCVDSSSGWCSIGSITGSTLEEALQCLKKHLEKIEYGFDNVVFVNLFVKDMSQFVSMNRVYSEYMPEVLPPARSCVETDLPPTINVSMMVVAHKPVLSDQTVTSLAYSSDREAMHVQSISHWAPANIGPYSQCIGIGGIYYLAGQIPLVPGTMEIFHRPIPQQCLLTFRHVTRILEAMNSSLTLFSVFQAICYIKSIEMAAEVADLWPEPHTTVTVIVVNELPKSVDLEWEVIACRFSNPLVKEDTKSIEGYNIHLKKCFYSASFVSSLVCNIRLFKEGESKSSDSGSAEGLKAVLKHCISFLRTTDGKYNKCVCTLKLFFRSDSSVALHIHDVVNTIVDERVVVTAIPVLACKNPEICLTITGLCH